ncbi:hypothetical protein ARAM_007048 [Aspergillus rambellii]|uniref:Uncharacterized protein n=1 Tax=Aspergillus rambellii TaxID=308745 RepID=A0A0F8UJ95_9EURO|nr:hypothetical protein ARAM_007048 [Aspergillus rambellii]
MVYQTASPIHLDPTHTSCIGGRTVLTCRSCAGNAPRGAICTSCSGRGFNIFICAHCNPAGAASNAQAARSLPNGASEPSTPASLSRSSSTSVFSFNDQITGNPWRRSGDRDGGSGGGRLQTNANQPRSS